MGVWPSFAEENLADRKKSRIFAIIKTEREMNNRRYTLPEDKDGMAAEPAVVCSPAAQDLQTLRHNIVDAVYQSHDTKKLQSCYVFLTQGARFLDTETTDDFEEEKPLTRKEGEQLLRDTLVPALRDVKEAERRGESLPDAHELLYMDEIWQS